MEAWYTATETFGPADGEGWTRYLAWSGLHQLGELVTLDPMLGRRILDEVKDLYWDHIVREDYMLDYFRDLPFMLGEIAALAGTSPRNVLCVVRNPASEPVAAPADAGFTLLGYDLVDVMGSASAISNCGGFPLAFDNGELNRFGLLRDRARAFDVQAALRAHYPREAHADCHVWAVFRSAALSIAAAPRA